MGRPRQRPERLAEKLKAIRAALALSQTEIVRALQAEDLIVASQVAQFEAGRREPSLIVLLRYARLAGVPLDVLADDALELPAVLPGAGRRSG